MKFSSSELRGKLNDVFGSTRAEYFREEIYELFTTPSYWPELQSPRPCLLVGGRGTGKTTALRGLSYEGLNRLATDDIREWNHIGLYWRIDTNTVRAFRGASLTEEDWIRYFSHYLNIVLVQLLVEFIAWVGDSGREPVQLDHDDLNRCCRALLIEPVNGTVSELASKLDDALIDFEAAINNISATEKPRASVLGRPLAYLTRALRADDRLAGKRVFFLVDEYENFEDYQQRVFNTLIKHAGDEGFTFKIGMKTTGHRERTTTNPNEMLVEPADYALIDISDSLNGEHFARFAKDVCAGRLARISEDVEPPALEQLLPGLTDDAEADLLGVQDKKTALRERLVLSGASDAELDEFDAMTGLAAYMVEYWARSQSEDELTVLRSAISSPAQWRNRLNNYQHAALYTVRRGRRGISKYYAGWNTYVLLADGNIRFLLQLVNEALQEHVGDNRTLETPVSFHVQTESAQAVGRRLVEQLQGLSAQGGDLTKFVLSLGRVFQVMASSPEGHAPEVSQFRVSTSGIEPFDSFSEDILTAAVMHLAVRRFPGDKMAATSGETKDFNYQLHPIFAPFFVFSYRSKRRMEIEARDVYGLVRNPRVTIRDVLARSSRIVPEDLPEQMSLFQEYFG